MKNLRVYSFDFIDSKIKLNDNYKLPNNIIEQINIFSNEIVKEYQIKQKGRKGIKTLGNERKGLDPPPPPPIPLENRV